MSELPVPNIREHDEVPEDPAVAAERYGRMSPEELVATLLKRDGRIRQLYDESRSDGLTGVLNRRGFEEQYAMSAARHRRRGEGAKPDLLVLVDLDEFKHINDTDGHEGGDIALKETAAILGISLREDDVIGRLGGDEFGAILVGATVEEGTEIFERIRYNMETFHLLKTEQAAAALPTMPTLSVGIARIDYSRSFNKMAAAVDATLYAAKESGRNQVHVLPTV